jgi:hypothetical protein
MKYQNLKDPTIRFRQRDDMVDTVHLVIEFPMIRCHRAVDNQDILDTAGKMALQARKQLESEQ